VGQAIRLPRFEEKTMDLRMYYQKVRELERSFKAAFPVVVSQETPDGGTAGLKTEVPIHVAARMIVDGHAVLASEKEAQEFLEQKMAAKKAADQLQAAARMQVTVMSDSDLQVLKDLQPSPKK
jgi:hypothetical protein